VLIDICVKSSKRGFVWGFVARRTSKALRYGPCTTMPTKLHCKMKYTNVNRYWPVSWMLELGNRARISLPAACQCIDVVTKHTAQESETQSTIPLRCLVSHDNRFRHFAPLLVKCFQTLLCCIVVKPADKNLAEIFVLQTTQTSLA